MKSLKTLLLLVLIVLSACSSDTLEELEDLLDAEQVDREAIDVSRMGVNAFGNKPAFGSVCEQYQDVATNLGLRFIRMQINWNDDIQSSPTASQDFSFYDELVGCIPDGVDALLVVEGLPSWMSNPSNWIDNNPRLTFVNLWFQEVVNRYRSNNKIVGFQVWNEPNADFNSENTTLDVLDSPANYVEMLAAGYSISKDLAPSKRVLNAATTSINQNFTATLDYNRDMILAGAGNFVDVFAIHFYGKQFERVLNSDGVGDFLRSLGKSIWITESGEQGVNEQLAYVETAWPFLRSEIPQIDRIYYFQYASNVVAESAFGLRNISADFPISDLYLFLSNL